MGLRFVLIILFVAVSRPAKPQSMSPEVFEGSRDYSAAFYSTFGHGPTLVVFPSAGKAFDISVSLFGLMVYAPDGTSLYGGGPMDHSTGSTLFKLDLRSGRFTSLIGSKGIYLLAGLAVSARGEKVVFSGHHRSLADEGCGIFELDLASAAVTKSVDNSDCSRQGAWLSLSLSPDGSRAVAVRRHRLELIDLATGAIRALAGDFEESASSPDGRWIAARTVNGTILFDASTLEQRMVTSADGVAWSPDSRFLLGQSASGCLFSYAGSLTAFDIVTRKKKLIESSRCKVDQPSYGWVAFTQPTR